MALKPAPLTIKEDDDGTYFIGSDGLKHAIFELDSEGYVQRMIFNTEGFYFDILDPSIWRALKCMDKQCSSRVGKSKTGENIEVRQDAITIARPGVVPRAHAPRGRRM